ncbi:MAG: hypothetical protein ABI688_11915 [Bacteroidota bacterium]
MRFKNYIFSLMVLLTGITARSQKDSSFCVSVDSLPLKWVSVKTNFYPESYFIYHSPDKEDYKIYGSCKYLVDQLPTEKNHKKYIALACALWDLGKTKLSEKMFSHIVNSNIQSYNSTLKHSSGTLYGYGSYTSDHKNTACIYLTKINIEQKQFKEALFYLGQAVKKYKVTYSCGTSYYWQKDEYDFLYAACYDGLHQAEKVLSLLLPEFLGWNNRILIRSIKRMYSRDEIKKQLEDAERSITCTVDTVRSESYVISDYGGKDEKKDTIRYYAGSGTITLFKKKIDMPYPKLENGEALTRDYYVNLFRQSDFYSGLSVNVNNITGR